MEGRTWREHQVGAATATFCATHTYAGLVRVARWVLACVAVWEYVVYILREEVGFGVEMGAWMDGWMGRWGDGVMGEGMGVRFRVCSI